jgi:hypothetical protein
VDPILEIPVFRACFVQDDRAVNLIFVDVSPNIRPADGTNRIDRSSVSRRFAARSWRRQRRPFSARRSAFYAHERPIMAYRRHPDKRLKDEDKKGRF